MTAPALEARGLTVRYGGVLALDNVNIVAEVGAITGLIGPNGAGKSTFFGACEGTVRATSGTVDLFGKDVSRFGPARRSRLGLGRTFQQVQLFTTMSVRHNIALGHEAGDSWRHPLAFVAASRSERLASLRLADELMDLCALSDVGDRPAGSLSTGQRRMVELARALASPARLLLMDEPSSGLSGGESEFFAEAVRRAMRQADRSVLIVEHDIELVSALCDRVYVLDFGKLIFTGTMNEVLASQTVRESYLGVTTPLTAALGPAEDVGTGA